MKPLDSEKKSQNIHDKTGVADILLIFWRKSNTLMINENDVLDLLYGHTKEFEYIRVYCRYS